VQSKRSEVLFVDYIAEHLTPNGRAAIVVPEGIIFQSQSAYVALRKMLVENHLAAVISLPAGVFNPYSGVKTSILILDRAVAKASEHVAFFKIENDGFALGAQRKAVKGSQLAQVKAELGAWLQAARAGSGEGLESSLGSAVERARLAEDGDYNLSAERYRRAETGQSSGWPIVKLGELCEFRTGGTPTSTIAEYYTDGQVPWLVSGDIHKREIHDCEKRITQAGVENSNARPLRRNSVLIALNGQGKTRGTVALLRMDGATCNQSLVAMYPLAEERLIPEFLFWALRSKYQEIRDITGDNQRSGLNIPILKGIEIPLPPLEVQREIVAEVEGYQRVIDGARAVLDSYRPHIPVDAEWPLVPIGQVCAMGGKITSDVDLSKPYFGADSFEANTGRLLKLETAEAQRVNGPVYEFNGKRLLYSKIRPYLNKLTVIETDAYCSSDMYPLAINEAVADITFIEKTLLGERFQDAIRGYYERASIPKINRDQLFGTKIALPPLDIQRAIVAEIKSEQALVDGNRDLIARFEKKIDAAIARVWGEAKAEVAA
jgi:type I restriction enzyme M protein